MFRLRSPLHFALLGLLFAQGAPAGLYVHKALFDPFGPEIPRYLLVYVWAGTSLFFPLFGWILGAIHARLDLEHRKLSANYRLFSRHERRRQKHLLEIARAAQLPVTTSIEFLEGLLQGDFGAVTPDQRSIGSGVLEELGALDRAVKTIQSLSDAHRETVDLQQLVDSTTGCFGGKVLFTSVVGLDSSIVARRAPLASSLDTLLRIATDHARFPVRVHVFAPSSAVDAPVAMDPEHPEVQATFSDPAAQRVLAAEATLDREESVPNALFETLEGSALAESVYMNGGRFWIDFSAPGRIRFFIAFPSAGPAVPKREVA